MNIKLIILLFFITASTNGGRVFVSPVNENQAIILCNLSYMNCSSQYLTQVNNLGVLSVDIDDTNLGSLGSKLNGMSLSFEDDGEMSVSRKVYSWGLDRVDQKDLPLDGFLNAPYQGNDVIAFVIDTGLYKEHNEFQFQFQDDGYDFVDDDYDPADCNGHGTHVSGTITGINYGVSQATVIPVRVLGCNGIGKWSYVLDSLDWVAEFMKNSTARAVINMSLGGANKVLAVDRAINKLVLEHNIVVVVAAGNSGTDACKSTPGSASEAITVAASQIDDSLAGFSNLGPCVDIIAPGRSIRSAWIGSLTSTRTISGTSMASPHVAGIVALVLEAYPDMRATDVRTFLQSFAFPGKITNIDGTNTVNLLSSALVPSLATGTLPIPTRTTITITITIHTTTTTTVIVPPETIYYKMNSDTYKDGHLTDISGNGYHARAVCEFGKPELMNNSFLRIKNQEYLRVTDVIMSPVSRVVNLTVSARVKLDPSKVGWTSFVSADQSSWFSLGYDHSRNKKGFNFRTVTGEHSVGVVIKKIEKNRWYHITGVYTTIGRLYMTQLYVDGVLIDIQSRKAKVNVTPQMGRSARPLLIGHNPTKLNELEKVDRPYEHDIASVQIWVGTALNIGQIQAINT